MKSTISNQITKNLLKDNTCKTCKGRGPNKWLPDSVNTCLFWYGEAVGWQWRACPEEGTCEYYEERNN